MATPVLNFLLLRNKATTDWLKEVSCKHIGNIRDRFREKGPNAYIITFPVRAIAMYNACVEMYRLALQLHDRYSDSQCVRRNV